MIVAPHMDDEVLACGALISFLNQKELVYIVYATDGMRSPSPIIPKLDSITADLGQIRKRESVAAMELLGIKEENLYFLDLPESRLNKNVRLLEEKLRTILQEIQPDFIFMPFRYDRHPDHLAVNHVLTSGQEQGWHHARLLEYFVYYRWKLLPKKDIRKYIKTQFLIQLDTKVVAQQKRLALDCFRSQTTIYYPWQTRPILTPVLLDEESQNPEFYLLSDPSTSGSSVLAGPILWIKLAHRLEPVLKKWKYLVGAYLKRIL